MLRRLVAAVALVAAVILIGGLGYFSIPQPLLPEAHDALASTPDVAFRREADRYVFEPTATATTGLILYPGGKVDPVAYAPTARRLAELGYLVEVVPMPANLAVLGIDRAGDALAAHTEIQRWAIGGHSLGGSMAAQYLASHPGSVHGLVLWASYSAATLNGDAEPSFRSLLVYGSLDAGAASYTSTEHLSNLGAPPEIVVIEGGNHEQMGWYTGQPNDPTATISRDEQQRQLIGATATFLASLGP
jgi:Alpha/beta hydrolase family